MKKRQLKQVGYYFHTNGTIIGYQSFPFPLKRHQYHLTMDTYDEMDHTKDDETHTSSITSAFARQVHLKNSFDYNNYTLADSLEQGNCILQHSWQSTSFPTCNSIHEVVDFISSYRRRITSTNMIRYLTHGYWRDVWSIQDTSSLSSSFRTHTNQSLSLTSLYTFKTLRYSHEWNPRNMDRHVRDASTTQELTSSPFIIKAYAYCGNTILMEYGTHDLYSFIMEQQEEMDPIERIKIAYQVASSIAQVHHRHYKNHDDYNGNRDNDNDDDGIASIAHTDISPGQFVYSQGIFKLNDFNRCRFITRNNITNKACPFYIESNNGRFRSPEEYSSTMSPLTEKIDIFSMGNIFYFILTKKWPFEDESGDKARQKIQKGEKPPLFGFSSSSSSSSSEHWANQAFIQAMEWCWTWNATKRPTAKTIQKYLETKMTQAGIHEYTILQEE